MKKLLSAVLCLALMVSAMSTTVFAADKPDGSAANPFTDVPASAINGDTGRITATPKEIEVTGQKFGLSIMAVEKKQVAGDNGKSKWVLTNQLTAPTNSTVKTEIAFINPVAANTMELRINNILVPEGAFNFTVGTTQRMVLSVKDNTGNKIGEMFWDFTIPNNDKTPPVLKVTSKSGDIEIDDSTGVITVSADSSLSRLVQFIAEDKGSGLASMQVQYFTDAARKTLSIEQNTHNGVVFPCPDDKTCKYNKCVQNNVLSTFKNVFGSNAIETDPDTNSIISAQWNKDFNESDEYATILTVDALGNKSTHMVNIVGLSSQIDTAPPTVSVGNLDKTTNAAGKVTGITGKLTIADSLSGLAEVTVANGTNILFENKQLGGVKSTEVPFALSEGDSDKKIIVNARDKNGNALAPAWVGDYASEFSGSGGGSKPDPDPDPGPGPSKDTTPPVMTYISSTPLPTGTGGAFMGITAKFRVVDETALGQVHASMDSSIGVKTWDAPSDTTVKEYIMEYPIGYQLPNRTVTIVAKDKAGNVITGNKDLSTVYKNLEAGKNEDGTGGSGGSGGTKPDTGDIKSNRDLRKAITGPFWVYEEDFSNLEFTLDSKYKLTEDVEFTLKRGSKEIDDTTSQKEFLYSFEKGYDKTGDYTLVATYGDYECKIGFVLEYRDESELANALKVTQESEDGYVLINLTLNRDLIDDAKKTQWLLPDGSKDTGYNVEYKVTTTGTYSFKMKLDGETYIQKVTVSSLDDDWDDSNDDGWGSSSGSSSGNIDGYTPYNGNSAPVPGKGLISNITTSQLTIEVPMSNWDSNVWSIQKESLPSNVTYSVNGSKIVFQVPNTTFQMGFRFVNKSKQYVNYNFPVSALNGDGSNKSDNAQTGGAGTPFASTSGPAAIGPLNLEYKKRKGTVLDDSEIL